MRRAMLGPLALLLVWCCLPACAQQVLMDRGVRAAGLWCFPLASDPLQYVYIPARAALALDDQGQPQFSFVRYTTPQAAAEGAGETITAAGGGGILTLLVLYETPEEMVAEAERVLQEQAGEDEVALRGPIVFREGTYALISSILNPADGSTARKLLATGRAPVLEGNRIALSFDLGPEQSSLLLASFQMATPDVSLVFDMTFSGLSEAYDADLTVDWSQVHNSESFKAGGNIYFVSAEVELAFDELLRTNAIKLRSSGTDEAMEGLLNTVYAKLMDLLFKPVEPERVPADQQGGLMQALGSLLGSRGGGGGGSRFGLNVGYQLKEMRSEGTSVLSFDHRAAVDRHSFITYNAGDLYQRYGADVRYFRDVAINDPVFQQREIQVAVDGALLPDFGKIVNTVTVTLRKKHQSGAETLREAIIDRASLAEGIPSFRLTYGWDGDTDRMAWLGYEYRTRWSFEGGGRYDTDWVASDAPMIDVYAPYERRTVQMIGDAAALKEQGVRAVIVQVQYPFFGQQRRQQIVGRPEQSMDQEMEIVLPRDQFEVDTTTSWVLEGGQRLSAQAKDSSGLVFVDELPPATGGG